MDLFQFSEESNDMQHLKTTPVCGKMIESRGILHSGSLYSQLFEGCYGFEQGLLVKRASGSIEQHRRLVKRDVHVTQKLQKINRNISRIIACDVVSEGKYTKNSVDDDKEEAIYVFTERHELSLADLVGSRNAPEYDVFMPLCNELIELLICFENCQVYYNNLRLKNIYLTGQ